jgi:glucosamine-6-phosphate deaminase
MMHENCFGNLRVRVYENRSAMGADAAKDVAEKINDLLTKQEFVTIIFAAAPSQNEFLFFLSKQKISWSRINCFQMDEYVGLKKNSHQLFGNFLKERLFDKVPFRAVSYLDGNASDIDAECERYSNLLNQYPPDITCMGIGVNAHIAFNDPHVANFNDPLKVKTVDLDLVCRQQQVDDGCFDYISEVPISALTLTIPALLQSNYIYCIVPGVNKAPAVYHTLSSEMNEKYPSTALRMHANTFIYLDIDSATQITKQSG